MKKILIVDDDTIVRSFFVKSLQPHADSFEVSAVKNGQEAIDVLNEKKIDLVVTDLMMPVMDGFELLSHMSKHHPETPAFVMTANGSPEIEKRINSLGSTKYFEKPIDIKSFTDAVFEELSTAAAGQIRGISLPSFLQLVEMEKKTCTLRIKSAGKSGSLFFTKGILVTAIADHLRNEEAALEIVSWEKVSITIETTNKIEKNRINKPLIKILMDGIKLKDEKKSKIKKFTETQSKKSATDGDEKSITPEKEIGEPETVEPKPQKKDAKSASEAFKKIPGVIEYGVFNENDELKIKSDNFASTFTGQIGFSFQPYFTFSDELEKTITSGNLKYIIINSSKENRHLIFKHNKVNYIVCIKLGFQPLELIKKIKTLSITQ